VTRAIAECGVEIPQETAGPYPGDGSNGPNVLEASGVVRQDITSSFGTSTTKADGVPLTVTLTLLDNANGCVPLAGAAVYAWHCDKEGRYSLYDSGLENENFLRGVQEADANGEVTFKTIYPGAYNGRWPHIHFEVFESMNNATAGRTGPCCLADRTDQRRLPGGLRLHGLRNQRPEFPQHHPAVGQRVRRGRRHLPAGHHVGFRLRRLQSRAQRHHLGQR
jgi:hypothetical protein